MNAFLRNVLAQREREQLNELLARPGRELAGGHLDLHGPGGDMRSPKAKEAREVLLKERAERVTALRAQGLLWTEIAAQLGISPRAARFAVSRMES